MGQVLLLFGVVALVATAFWVSTRLSMRAGVNVPLPSSYPPTYGPPLEGLSVNSLVELSVRAVFRYPTLLLFASATTVVSIMAFGLDSTATTSWIAAGKPLQALSQVTSWKDLRGLAESTGPKALTQFVSSWVRVAIALATVESLRAGTWSVSSVFGQLRARWRAAFGFAILFVLSGTPGQLIGALAPPRFAALALPFVALPFLLGLGAPLLANENLGATAAARRSVRLVISAWPTRLSGHLVIGLPIAVVLVGGGIVGGIVDHGAGAVSSTLVIAVSTSVAVGLSWPIETVGAVFDALLYQRLAQSESGGGQQSAPPDLSFPSPA